MKIFGNIGREAVAVRLWASVTKGKHCWIWHGACTPKGYGVMSISNRTALVHRVSFALEHGEDALQYRQHICHNCDNPSCVRPDHLFQATAGENMADSFRKGRTARGNSYPHAKLNPDAVRCIRKVAITRQGFVDCMIKYDVGASTISDVLAHRSWGHVV